MAPPQKFGEFFKNLEKIPGQGNRWKQECLKCGTELPKGRTEHRQKHLLTECQNLSAEERDSVLRMASQALTKPDGHSATPAPVPADGAPPPAAGPSAGQKRKREAKSHAPVSLLNLSASARRDPSTGSSGVFSETVETELAALTNDICWCCGASPVHVTPVISQAQQKDLADHFARHLVAFNELRDPRNAVPLCGLCKANFEIPNPNVIFVPSDLAWILQWERDDQRRREKLAAEGREHHRVPPTEIDYAEHLGNGVPYLGGTTVTASGTYDVYITKDYFPKLPARQPLVPGQYCSGLKWWGSPTAACLKAFGVLAKPVGIPPHVFRTLSELSFMWFSESITPVPGVVENGTRQDHFGVGSGSQGNGNDDARELAHRLFTTYQIQQHA